MISREVFQLLAVSCRRGWRRASDAGNAAIEFALIGPVFIGMLCAIMEFSGILFVQTLLYGGARQASRFGITGAVPTGITREDMIRKIIADNSFGIIDIDDIEMTTLIYKSFADVGKPEPFKDDNSNGAFDNGEKFTDVNGNGRWD